MNGGPVALVGHVDHGKSAVFRSVGGGRTRRESPRGNTVDFSTARVETPDGPVTLLDVPGHRDYRHNTFTAIGGSAAFVLVVAADEGLAAQSREHLEFAIAAGLRHGLLWWTKADRVSASELASRRRATWGTLRERFGLALPELVLGDTRAPLPETVAAARRALGRLVGASPTSEDAGEGGLGAAIVAEAQIPWATSDAHQRGWCWIDRTFVSRASGRVGTATWRGGEPLEAGVFLRDATGARWRVRALERHGAPATRAVAGERVALVLSGEAPLERGTRLFLGAPLAVSTRADLFVTPLAERLAAFRSGSTWEVWAGPARRYGRVDGLRDDALARVRWSEPWPIAVGERLVLRDGGGERTIGFAQVLDPAPTTSFRSVAPFGGGSPWEAFVDRRGAVSSDEGFRWTLRRDGASATSPNRWREALREIAVTVETAKKPVDERALRRGPAVARFPGDTLPRLLEEAASLSGLRRSNGWWWSSALETDAEGPWARLTTGIEERVAAGRFDERGATRPEREALRWLVATGRVVALEPGLYWTRAAVDALVGRVRTLLARSEGGTLGELRGALGLSRREAVRCLETLDRLGITVRDGEKRRLSDSVPSS